MRGGSAEETLWDKEYCDRLSSTHGSRVFAYRADNGRFMDPLLKKSVQTCGQQISYFGVGYHYQNAIA